MSTIKGIFCDVCVVLILGLIISVTAEQKNISITTMEEVAKGNCTCAGFPSNVLEVGSQPLLSQNPGLEVKCDDDGDNTCKQLCIALATAAKAKGPEVLCARLKDAEELKLSAFSKICDRPWMYADMTAEAALCCTDSRVKTCASADTARNSTEPIEAKTVT